MDPPLHSTINGLGCNKCYKIELFPIILFASKTGYLIGFNKVKVLKEPSNVVCTVLVGLYSRSQMQALR